MVLATDITILIVNLNPEWDPEEAGLSRVEHQAALSLVPAHTDICEKTILCLLTFSKTHVAPVTHTSFVSENEATANQYLVTHSPAASPPAHTSASSPPLPSIQSHNSYYSPSGTPSAIVTYSQSVGTPARTAAPHSDIFYLDRYCHVIGPWFDLFDREGHFSLVVPHLSLENHLLKLSSLACASRQQHRISSSNFDTALRYYDDALQMLTASLRDDSISSSAAVFASCLLLAHCEMIGASTQDWHLHIAGAYSLIRAHGWHGQSGGLGQACFWYPYST